MSHSDHLALVFLDLREPTMVRDWFDVAEQYKYVPLVMVPDGATNESSRPSFFNIFDIDDEVPNLLPSSDLRKSTKCCGSSHGWLIMFDQRTSQLTLHNPFTKYHFLLPLLPRDIIIHKAILSSNPLEEEESTVMMIFGEDRKLAFARKEKKSWTVIHDAGCSFDDVIYSNGCFFAVDECGGVMRIDLLDSSVMLVRVTEQWFFRGKKVYLAGTSWGGLWLIIKNSDNESGRACWNHKFNVYELNQESYLWERVCNLSGHTLFLGQNHSVALRTSNEREKNCIYFTDDSVDGDTRDTRVFQMDDMSVVQMPWSSSESTSLRPTWVIHE